jgi:hypothetical protein
MIDRLALILLLAGSMLFGAIFAAELTAPSAPAEIAVAASTAPVHGNTPPSSVTSVANVRPDSMVAEILARPLFSATRRPPPQSDSPTGDSALSDTRLTGIVTEPGYRFAIFAPNGAKALIVREGDTVSGWRVENITPSEVSLTGPEGTKTLQPKNDPNLVRASPPMAAPPAPLPPTRAAAVAAPSRPGFPAPFPNRPPLRPGQPRGRR